VKKANDCVKKAPKTERKRKRLGEKDKAGPASRSMGELWKIQRLVVTRSFHGQSACASIEF